MLIGLVYPSARERLEVDVELLQHRVEYDASKEKPRFLGTPAR